MRDTSANRKAAAGRFEKVASEIGNAAAEFDWKLKLSALKRLRRMDGLAGLSLANLILVGDEVPSAYNRSRVGLVPVGLTLNPRLSVAESRSTSVELQDPPAGSLM